MYVCMYIFIFYLQYLKTGSSPNPENIYVLPMQSIRNDDSNLPDGILKTINLNHEEYALFMKPELLQNGVQDQDILDTDRYPHSVVY